MHRGVTKRQPTDLFAYDTMAIQKYEVATCEINIGSRAELPALLESKSYGHIFYLWKYEKRNYCLLVLLEIFCKAVNMYDPSGYGN
jgi:hypothetical protein